MLELEDGAAELSASDDDQLGGPKPMPIKAAQAEEEQKGPMINAKHRRMASQWWETRPLRHLVAMRLIM